MKDDTLNTSCAEEKPSEEELLEHAIYCCYAVSKHVDNIPHTMKCDVKPYFSSKKEYKHTFAKEYTIDFAKSIKVEHKSVEEIQEEVVDFYTKSLWDSWQFIHDYLNEHEKVKEIVVILPLQCTNFFLNRVTFTTVFAFDYEGD